MRILVTGASGQLGSKVVELLLASYKGVIIAGSRHPEKLQHLTKLGVEVRKVDFDDVKTTDEAFKNVDKVLIVSTDALAVPGLRLKQHLNAIESAKKNQVKHVVYTSLTSADNSPISFAPDHLGTENALKASGLNYTILRNNWYLENLLPDIERAQKSGVLMSSTEQGRVGFISREDCARVAAAVLVSDKYKNATLDVTGAETYSYQDIAQLLKASWTALTSEQLSGALVSQGLPSFVVDLVVTYEQAVAQGRLDIKNSLVLELTGRKPKSLADLMR